MAEETGVDPKDMERLDELLKATEHVTYGLSVNHSRQEKVDNEDWYVAHRAYEFGESSPNSGAARRIVDRAIASLDSLLQRRPKRGRRMSAAAFHFYFS